MEMIENLHPSTCEHQECRLVCEKYFELQSTQVETPAVPIRIEDVYVVDQHSLGRTFPKVIKCSLCSGDMKYHTPEMCEIEQGAKEKAKAFLKKWREENKHKWETAA